MHVVGGSLQELNAPMHYGLLKLTAVTTLRTIAQQGKHPPS
jgi:hypothetical protein